MVLQTLLNHNFLKPPEDYDILFELSPNCKKVIALEVVDALSLRFIDSINEHDSAQYAGKNKTLVLPVTFEPFPMDGGSVWKLPTWQHVKWVLQSMSPVFSLGLDSINSISTAVGIYCLWLKNPQSRPIGVNEHNLQEFISFILLDLSDIFEPRKFSDSKASANNKRHSELCQFILKTIAFELIPNCPLFAEKTSETWDLMVRLLLGITDSLLWNDKQNYLADDLTENLLYTLFCAFLQSGICCDDLWKKFSSCFKLWCHRVKTVLAWGSVLLALTTQVADYLVNETITDCIVFGMHSVEYRAIMDSKFVNYTWIRISNFMPKLSNLSGDIFLRAVQSLQKIIEAWSNSCQVSSLPPNMVARRLPCANTLFDLYGDLIFEAISLEKTSHEKGRALSVGILCQILSRWQYREELSTSYLTLSFHYLKISLMGDINSAASTIFCIENVLISGLLGVRSLIIPIFSAITRLIPRTKSQKQQLIIFSEFSQQELNLACYRLLSLVNSFVVCDDPFILAFKGTVGDIKTVDHVYSDVISKCFPPTDIGYFRAISMNILVGSLLMEDSVINIRFLLSSISGILYSEFTKIPSLAAVLVKIFEDILCKPPVSWTFSSPILLVEIQIFIVGILEQWTCLGPLESEDSERICMTLIKQSMVLYSKQSLPLYLHLIFSIFEAIFPWISMSASSACISAFLSTLVKFLNEPAGPLNRSARSVKSPISPVVYGVKTRKSLADRVFTVEVGTADERPGSLSPTLLKSTDEIFFEYTEATLQRLLNILFQEQINSNYPLMLDSSVSELIDQPIDIKYFAVSSTIIVGFSDHKVFIRSSVGKFVWELDFKMSKNEMGPKSFSQIVPSIIDEDPSKLSQIHPFLQKAVVLDNSDSFPDDEILNEFSWTTTLNNNPSFSSKFTNIVNEVNSHLKEEIVSHLPLKSRTSVYQPQVPAVIDYPEIISQMFLTHLGFLNITSHSLVCPISPCSDDISRLDGMSSREIICSPIHFIASNYYCKRSNMEVSQAFEAFVKKLGSFRELGSGPVYADSSVEMEFKIISESDSENYHDSAVSIIWCEDFENFSESIPQSNSNFIYIVIVPVLFGGEKGRFFRIRIIIMDTLHSAQEVLYSFGPLCDGMIVENVSLSRMVRETVLSAHRFVSNFLNNSPNPVMKRQAFINSIIFKNYSAYTYGGLLKSVQQQQQ